ncbi:hypothetical protein ES703_106810 [subsurface metagenome]
MKDQISSDQDFVLWFLLNQVRDVLFKAREKELRLHGITGTQAAVLFVIQAIGGEVTTTDISRWLVREHHSVSCLLDRMERAGLVSRSKERHAKSLTRVALTEKGRQAYCQSTKRASIHNIMRVISQEERQKITAVLIRVRDEGFKQQLGDLKPPFP